MHNAELKRRLLGLAADVREGRYEPDWDLGKSEYLGASQELAAAYEARVRPLLEAYAARGLMTEDELGGHASAGADREVLADQLQALAECLPG